MPNIYYSCMKYFLLPFVLLATFFVQAQNAEVYPMFPECESVSYDASENCFKNTLVNFIVDHFDINGAFKLMYVNAAYDELKAEVARVFDLLPVIEPAKYNADPTYMQFRLPIKIPLERNQIQDLKDKSQDNSVFCYSNSEF